MPLAGIVITQHNPFWPLFYSGLALLGIGIFLIRKYGKDKKKSNESSAIGILKERYAKGEITKEEFEKMKKDLENS